jgi:hypothetical protein
MVTYAYSTDDEFTVTLTVSDGEMTAQLTRQVTVLKALDPDLDTDGDGYPDAFEIKAGTDPYDPDDYPGGPDTTEDGEDEEGEGGDGGGVEGMNPLVIIGIIAIVGVMAFFGLLFWMNRIGRWRGRPDPGHPGGPGGRGARRAEVVQVRSGRHHRGRRPAGEDHAPGGR